MSQQKESIREKLKTLRSGMTAKETLGGSRAIAERLLAQIDSTVIKTAHIYASLPALNEVDTMVLIKKLKTDFPQIKIVKGAGKPDQPPPDTKFDLIIVPVLGFDAECNRLGMGGGWYDRFLAAQPRSLKIGLAFQKGLVKQGLPREPHDIPLDKIVTEEMVYLE